MKSQTVTGCGSSNCQCAGDAVASVPASINGILLHAEGERPDAATLLELAHTELLRQQAVKLGLLPRHTGLTAPELDAGQRKIIEDMVDQAVMTPEATAQECERYFEANKHLVVTGQALHVRHILFAVTPGVNVHALTVHAEKALLELSRQGVSPERFGQLAAEMSNCPTSTNGGDLGWIGPDDCAPELANELFNQKHSQWGMGVHPRLIHTRFGFHVIEVLGRRKGRQIEFEVVQSRIADRLALQLRAKALRDYMQGLAAKAELDGVELDPPGSPLIQ